MTSDPDTCPTCGQVHGTFDQAWACPEHGHRLYQKIWGRDVLNGGQVVELYHCPVRWCLYCKPVGLPEDVPQVAGLFTEDMPAVMRKVAR